MTTSAQTMPAGVTPNQITISRGASAQIINLSLTATIWLNGNPGVGDNNGTPLYPGTSLIWSKEELYYVKGTDTLSVAATDANIIVSYDVTEWQPNPSAIAVAAINSGNISQDRPVLLQTTFGLASGSATPTVDVSKYSSLYIVISTAATFTTGNSEWFQFNWFMDPTLGTVVRTEQMAVNLYNFNGGGGNGFSYQTNVKGAGFSISSVVTGGTFTVQIFGSYRQAAWEGARSGGLFVNNVAGQVLAFSNVATPAGDSYAYMNWPYQGVVDVHLMSTNVAGVAVSVPTPVPVLTYRERIYSSGPAGTGMTTTFAQQGYFRTVLPLQFSRFRITNLAGVAADITVYVTAVPN